jgi:hypothetical protein
MDRSTNMEGRGYQTVIGASLAVGPLVMTVGDLLHPQETSDISGQATIIVEQATEDLLDTMFSGPIAGPLLPVALAFFLGAAWHCRPASGMVVLCPRSPCGCARSRTIRAAAGRGQHPDPPPPIWANANGQEMHWPSAAIPACSGRHSQ